MSSVYYISGYGNTSISQSSGNVTMYSRGNYRGTGTVSSPSSVFSSSKLKSTSNFTFTAYFSLNGGSGTSTTKTSTGTTKTYYTNLGNGTISSGSYGSVSGTTLTFAREGAVAPSGTPTLNVKYNSTSTSTTDAVIYLHGAPSRTGYTFTGGKSDSGSVFSAGAKVSRSSGGSRTYIAQGSANTYYLKFNTNGGSGSMSNQTCKYGTSYNINKNTFIRDGYAFDGWNTKADGTGTKYTDGQKISNLTSSNGTTIDLYAQGKPLDCKAIYHWGTSESLPVNSNGEIIDTNSYVSGNIPDVDFWYKSGEKITLNKGDFICKGFNLIGGAGINTIKDTSGNIVGNHLRDFNLGQTVIITDYPFDDYAGNRMHLYPIWERVSQVYLDGEGREITKCYVYNNGGKLVDAHTYQDSYHKIIFKEEE